MSVIGQFIVFEKELANALIKRGFPLREIGGKIYNIYYFDDTAELEQAIMEIREQKIFLTQE